MRVIIIILFASILFSCGKKPIEPETPPPFEFKSSGTVKYYVNTLCNGYPLQMIDGGGNVSDKLILTSSWSVSFVRSRGDSVRISFNCISNSFYSDFDGEKMISRIYYQDQLLFSDTVIYSLESSYPYTYTVTSLGVLP